MKELIQKYSWFAFTSLFSLLIFLVTIEYQSIKQLGTSYNDWRLTLDVFNINDIELFESNSITRLISLMEIKKNLSGKGVVDMNTDREIIRKAIFSIKSEISHYDMSTNESEFYNKIKSKHSELLKNEIKCWMQLEICLLNNNKCQAFYEQGHDYVIQIEAFTTEMDGEADKVKKFFIKSGIKLSLISLALINVAFFLVAVIKISFVISKEE